MATGIARIFLFLYIVNFALARPVVVRRVHELHANMVDVAEDGTASSQNWWDDWLANAAADRTRAPTTPPLPDLGHLGLHNSRSSNVPSMGSHGLHPRSKDDFPPSSGSPNYSPIPLVPGQSSTVTPNQDNSWMGRLSGDNSPRPSPDNSLRRQTGNSNPSNSDDLWLSWLSESSPNSRPEAPDNPLRSLTDNSHTLSPDHTSLSQLPEDSTLPSSLDNSLPNPNPGDDFWLSFQRWLSLPNSHSPSPVNRLPSTALTTDESHPLNPDNPLPSPADTSHPSNPDNILLSWSSLDKSPTRATQSPDDPLPSPADHSHPSTPDYSWPSRLSADNSFPSSPDTSPSSTDNPHPPNPDDFWPNLLSADSYLPSSLGNSNPSGQDHLLPSSSSTGHSPSSSSSPSSTDHPVHSPPLKSLSTDHSAPNSWLADGRHSPTTASSWSPTFSPSSSWPTDYSPPSSSSTDHSPMSIDYSPPSSWSAAHPLPSPLTSTPGYSAPNSWLAIAGESHSPTPSSGSSRFSPPDSWPTDYSPPSSSSTDHSPVSIDYSPPSSWSTGNPLPSLTMTPGHSTTISWIADKSHSPSSWLPKYSPPSWSPTSLPLPLPPTPTTESLSGPHQSTDGYPPPGLEPQKPAMSSSSSESLDFLDKLLLGKIRRRVSESGVASLAQSEVQATSVPKS